MQKIKLKEIYLENPKTERSITFKIAKLNGNRFTELVKIDSQFRNIKREANLLFLMAQQSKEELLKQFEENNQLEAFKNILEGIVKGDVGYDDVVSLLESGNSEVFNSNLQRRIEIIKCMIDHTDLTKDIEELLEDKEFWDYQDIEYLVEISDSFRNKLYQ